MKEISLHVLDIAQNSIRAGASCIRITVEELVEENWMKISVEDNGCGMDESLLKNSTNPFTTTRKLRKVGLGIPFVAQMCEACDGKLYIQSEVGKGTIIRGEMRYNHIDRLPLGNMAETIVTLIMAKPEIKFEYKYRYDQGSFEVDTETIKGILGNVPINNLEILHWLKQYIREGEDEIR